MLVRRREVKSKPRLKKSKLHALIDLMTRSPNHEKAHFYLTGFTYDTHFLEEQVPNRGFYQR